MKDSSPPASSPIAATQVAATTTQGGVHLHWQEAVAGAVAGTISRTLMAPMERIKLVQQLQGTAVAKPMALSTTSTTPSLSSWKLAHYLYQTEGLASFWRGNLPNVLRVAGTAAMNMTCMDYYQQFATNLMRLRHLKEKDQLTAEQHLQEQRLISLVSGGLAGGTSTTILYPFEFVRTRLAMDMGRSTAAAAAAAATTTTAAAVVSTRQFHGMKDVVAHIWKHDGLIGFFEGYGVAVWGGIIYRLFYLGGYDICKKELVAFKEAKLLKEETASKHKSNLQKRKTIFDVENHDDILTPHRRVTSTWSIRTVPVAPPPAAVVAPPSPPVQLFWWERFMIAQGVSVFAGTIVYPFDTVRRRLMMQAGIQPESDRLYNNGRQCIRYLFAHSYQQGVHSLYRGLGPNLVRSIGSAMLLVLYDSVKAMLSLSP
jgi:solute carrier family 25 (mitochondrial adenine nucleotide translocator), member 4/5/6/31